MVAGTTEPRCSSLWQTSDLSIAAYLCTAGVPMHDAVPQRNPRYFDFVFSDPDNRCPGLAIQFVCAEAGRFDLSQRLIKKVVFDWPDRGLAGARGNWKTSDVQSAAWLVMQGIKLVGFRRTHRTRREYEFHFDSEDGQAATAAASYSDSNSRRYADAQKELNSLTMSRSRGGKR